MGDEIFTRSGYKVTWALTLFDLPTLTPKQRKAANKFREQLLDDGYTRFQLSVYQRWYPDIEAATINTQRIGARVPPGGIVDTLFITEKQFKKIITMRGRLPIHRREISQLELF